ncbi:hypothetical protein [Halobacteriovorax sp.]|uniref:hypothetical protein n=1 Tax=Halobacteriovorax sp. TaxID=2020862 RepID=UPI00356598E0
MIIIFLIFTIISLFLRTKDAKSIQECIPFYIVSTLSWISFLLYMYLDSILYIFTTFEITTFLIMITLGNNLSKFLQLKFISFFVLTLLYIFEGVFQQDILYVYVLISTFIALWSSFRVDKKIYFPFILFNIFSLMKAREYIESPFSVTVFVIGAIFLLFILLKGRLQSLYRETSIITFILWLGVFTFSIDLYFLLTVITLLLTVSLFKSFKLKELNKAIDILLYLSSLIVLIPFIKVSFFLTLTWLAIFSICLFSNKRLRDIGECHG